MYRQQAKENLMYRQQAREKLMQLFYQMDMNSDFSALQKELFFKNSEEWEKEQHYIENCIEIFLT